MLYNGFIIWEATVTAMTNKRGKNAQNLKSENRGLLLQLLATHAQTSRTELTQLSGLNKMTVSNITAEFIAQQYAVECSQNATRNNPIMLELSPKAPKVIGLLIRRNRVSAALCDFHLEIQSFVTRSFETCTEEELLDTVRQMIDFLSASDRVLGIGVGAIGPVDIQNGVILDPPNFHGIRQIRIVEFLENTYHLPVILNHHYNCEALAERYYGEGRAYQNYLFVGIEEGLGLGVILNGQLLSDFTGYDSDLGYLCVNCDDHTVRTGVPSGFLGAYVSLEDRNSTHFREELDTLSFALAGICNILYPQAVIIGDTGGILFGEDIAFMKRQINSRTLSKSYREIEVLRAHHNSTFETAGCAISIIQETFSGNLLFNTLV